MNPLAVSVIIPTYNRKASLGATLRSLAGQSLPAECFEVILADDGSTDGTPELAAGAWPFPLRYLRQANQGDAAARNLGASHSQADLLVFLDDDMVAGPDYLAALAAEHEGHQKRIVIGLERLWLAPSDPLAAADALPAPAAGPPSQPVPFAQVCSNNMSMQRQAYCALGMMQGLDFSGSSMWCDVDFAYRAYQQGFEFRRSARAICWHRDYTAVSLASRKRRLREVARRAPALFMRHPGLVHHLPMFDDKTPIAWGQDPARLIGRKLARHAASSRPALWGLEQIARWLEGRAPASKSHRRLDRWIVGGHMWRGYRQGLREAAGAIKAGVRTDD
ncbi:MAG: glycosyltransferase family 2 protein [Candidatus Promineifilaceae bacterium]